MPNILTSIIRSDREYKQLSEAVKRCFKDKPLPILASGLCPGASDAVTVALCEDTSAISGSPALIICHEEKECRRLCEDLNRFGIPSAFYIGRDLTFYNMTASHEFEHERLRVLSGLLDGEFKAVLTTPDVALGYTIPPEVLKQRSISIDTDTRIEPSVLAQSLVEAGFSRVDMVEGAGQFALRGGIVDIYAPGGIYTDSEGEIRSGALPLRIEFFDDEIDRMGVFDIESQRLSVNVLSAYFPPARELLPDKDALKTIGESISSRRKKTTDPKISEALLREENALSSDLADIGFLDKYISSVYPQKACLLSYFKEKSLVLVHSSNAVADRLKAEKWHEDEMIKSLLESGTISHKFAEYSAPAALLEQFEEKNVTVHLNSIAQGFSGKKLSGIFGFSTRQPVSYSENLDLLCEDLVGYFHGGYKVVVMTDNETMAKNLAELLENTDFNAVVINGEGLDYASLESKVVYITSKKHIQGYELPTPRYAVISTEGERAPGELRVSKRGRKKSKRSDAKTILSYTELEVGDLIVHENYGIGRYLGLEKIKIDGVTRDYINIQYAGNDRLCLQVDKMDLVSKYIGAHADDGMVKLSKMNADAWSRSKSRVKTAVKEMAKDLIKLYAERERRPGFAFAADDEMQRNFEEAFDYEETECQLDAVSDIKNDMMLQRPMDRLLCGDVGYGKTEVAFRAAYKAVLSGKQVAILVPTTILALQHYQTAMSRMRNFAVNIDMISRFRTPKQITQSLRRLERGDTDIIIGTHKLLGKEVKFRDLGLLIVDEEQRFGVGQKEKLKQLGGNIDVLTLSATPIPRTLNMAMGGIRDISVLDEAPGDRLPVQTYVLEEDELIINEAIRKELRRGGQVFYIHNFVESIDGVASRISASIPEARVTVAHGKMDKETLEDIWSNMLSGEIDILVCTTIIETGIDIPNANTIIADRADRLGLSQLHQLRGRVGRSSRRAYAYFTFPKGRALTEIASKRLEAIREYAEFGAGFRIALRDMEIRGAGNILGSEQHGHMEAIGYDLYIKLLNEAVLEEKGEVMPEEQECTVSFNCDAFIPDRYVRYPAQRMTLYKRIALIRNQYDHDDICDELLDRFGEMPRAVENLLKIALIRAYAIKIKLSQVNEFNGEIRMYQNTFDLDTWDNMNEASGDRLKIMMGQSKDNFVVLRLKNGENAIDTVYKMFEKYLETVQSIDKKKE